MTDATTAAPEQGVAAGRQRRPTYHVLELVELQEPATQRVGDAPVGWEPGASVRAWLVIGTEVRAATDREAIAAVLEARPPEERTGTYWAPLSKHYRPRTRAPQTVTTYVWE